ncbi:4-oxalocrotonate decarboxylase [Fictibacillus macauensis ZFHKF-1]|uniref:4-oxalocrotonate decarboxylase n=1 Tax=Fictibacillus macauensis ZFHKF-1 TaxID=1196324 RepID=I8UH77_9BACL|nr:2-keto-4-pentenoate hydratase [Fictibacillus macauensis]EIT86168.1 4-oxalocrotonate decarboxylase [Fictibacillus macauensis ZFHKF-1]
MTVVREQFLEMIDVLASAERTCREVPRLTEQHPALTIQDAYAMQSQWIQQKIQQGARRLGVKLGLTSQAKQQMMGIHEAIYGYLVSDMLALEWEPVSRSTLIHPKIEPEIAFMMKEDLAGASVTAEDVIRATSYVAPALEIIDSRYQDFKFTHVDVVADNCSSARFLIGSTWIEPSTVDLKSIGMVMSKNGAVATTGAGAAVLGDPAEAVAWCVRKLAQQNEGLKKGDIVLSGALSEAIPLNAGDTIQASFGILGTVSCHCGE